MKICAVQLGSLKGDLQGNLERHLRTVRQAVRLGAGLVFFPELSLSGYEPTLARELAEPGQTPLLDPLQRLCDQHGITVALGLPLATEHGVRIGMPVLRPGAPRLIYAKQRLHPDELPWFSAGNQLLVFQAAELRLAPAICYESMFDSHAEQVRALGADIYLASVAKSARGVEQGFEHYPEVARRFGMPVLMANCVGAADNFIGAGRSAAWDHQGRLLAALGAEEEGLVLLDTLERSASALPLAGPAS
ncbi:carbon-nitrogen hydrolase family protein [Pseudomonas sp. X10]